MTSAVASFLFAAVWKGTLLVVFALVVHRAARNRVPSRWLCALLLVAIVRLLVPVAPASSFSVFNLVPGNTARPATIGVADSLGPPAGRPDGLKPALRSAPAEQASWIPALLALWGAGVLFAIARAVLQTRRFRRQLASCANVDRDDVRLLVDECREILRIRRQVRVVTTSAVATPSLHGWLHPTLLLPEGFLETFTREQLRYVVLHELAHMRRSDVLINWIAAGAHALHWFNPLVRLAVARLAEERELASDALALAALRAEERSAYGGTVLELVDRMRVAPAIPALVGMTATPEQLKRRIVMIASFRQSRFSLVFAALVVAVGLMTLTDARAGEPMKRSALKMKEVPSPAILDILQKLETPMSAEFESVSLDDVLHQIMNTTAINVVIEDGAVDDATRAKRLDIKAKNVPAHMVLTESLGALNLAVKLTETGVLVVRAPEEMPMLAAKQEATRSMIRRSEGTPEGDAAVRKFIEVTEDGERGGGKRKLTLHKDDGEEEGTLEIEVVKEQ